MTRGKWVAVVVGLGVAACLASVFPQAWLWLAYRDAEVREALSIGRAGEGRDVKINGEVEMDWTRRLGSFYADGVVVTISDESSSVTVKGSSRRPALVKRWGWLPGREIVLRDGRCWLCLQDAHWFCPDTVSFSELLDDVHCTCPHPSHAPESE